jgi:hypothetical protein
MRCEPACLSSPAPHQTEQHEPDRTPEQRGEGGRRRGWDFPERRFDHAPREKQTDHFDTPEIRAAALTFLKAELTR